MNGLDTEFTRMTICVVCVFGPGQQKFSLAQSDSLLLRMRSVANDELTQMMQRRMSQENPIRASETEFIQRLQRLVVLAVNRIIYYGKFPNRHLTSFLFIFTSIIYSMPSKHLYSFFYFVEYNVDMEYKLKNGNLLVCSS